MNYKKRFVMMLLDNIYHISLWVVIIYLILDKIGLI